jgi:RNA polymerase sigma factor (sigma-70 family)
VGEMIGEKNFSVPAGINFNYRLIINPFELNEPELIKGLKEGDKEAFEKLVHIYKDKIYNTSLGFTQNEHDAEEITQEVFIRVFENIRSFKMEAALNTWMYRIAVTQSLDFVRKKNRKKRGGLLVSFFSKQEDSWEQPDFHHPGVIAEQKENASFLFKAIKQLPEQQQAAFVLQKIEGLTQPEVAEVLKTTVSAVESLLTRAKANLRKILEQYDYNHYE